MRQIKALLFDAGNTLIHLDYEFVCATIAAEDGPPDRLRLEAADQQVRFAMDRALLQRISSGEEIPSGTISLQATGLLRSYFSNLLRAILVPSISHERVIDRLLDEEAASSCGLWRHVPPDLLPLLAELVKRDYLLGVVSNSDGRLQHRLGLLGLRKYFRFILDSADVGIEKPDPRLFRIALEKCGVTAPESMYIGDLCSVDVMGARQVGMEGVLYDPGDLYGQIEPRRITSWSKFALILDR